MCDVPQTLVRAAIFRYSRTRIDVELLAAVPYMLYLADFLHIAQYLYQHSTMCEAN